MPIPREYRPVIADPVRNSQFRFTVSRLDYEVKLYDSWGLKFSVDKHQLPLLTQDSWPLLFPRLRYVQRYNNNDNGIGFLESSVFQIYPNGQVRELERFSYNNIHGPTVFEIPFYITFVQPS